MTTESRYTIQRQLAIHTGGTKFYQIIQVIDWKTKHTAIVNHYGKVPRHCSEVNPINCGAIGYGTSDYEGSFSYINKIITAKRKRGYEDWDATNAGFPTLDKLNDELVNIFDDDIAADIKRTLKNADYPNVESKVDLIEKINLVPKAFADNVVVQSPKWATW